MAESVETESATTLATVYAGWDVYQNDLREAIEPLTREQLALPVVPGHWPIGLLVQHIINDRIWWFHVWMNEGGPGITWFMHHDDEEAGTSTRSAKELVAALDASWEMIAGALDRWTVADFGQIFDAPPSLSDRERETFGPNTLQWITYHVMRHDIHHGGELAAGMGAHNLPTIWRF